MEPMLDKFLGLQEYLLWSFECNSCSINIGGMDDSVRKNWYVELRIA